MTKPHLPEKPDTQPVGTVVWHSSEDDGGPDVGVSLQLDHGAELWCGEISRALWQRADLAEFGDDTGSWLVVFGPGDQTTVVGKVDYDAGRALLELVLAPIIRAHATTQPEKPA